MLCIIYLHNVLLLIKLIYEKPIYHYRFAVIHPYCHLPDRHSGFHPLYNLSVHLQPNRFLHRLVPTNGWHFRLFQLLRCRHRCSSTTKHFRVPGCGRQCVCRIIHLYPVRKLPGIYRDDYCSTHNRTYLYNEHFCIII